jgi:hypothetical protein|tara:strand:- start:411 stop:899 length:489 start_codon:yes stop_codon:yes gene_type:complete
MVVIPTSILAKQGAKQAQKISVQYLGFDFVPLITSLFIFYVIAFVIAKFMQASQLASGGFMALSNLLGFKVPSSAELPDTWSKLFTETGYKGFKFWDIINITALLIVVVTALNFQKSTEATGNKVQPITWAIFGLIAGFITIAGISKLVMKFTERKFQQEFR